MADINDNSDIDLAIARVQLAIAESDIRNMKSKSRTNYSSRNNQSKSYKPNGVSASKTSNFTYSSPVGPRKVESFRAGERSTSTPNPRANEMRAGERSTPATKKVTRVKDTSFKNAGLVPALTSGNAKKFAKTFKSKGLIPALRGK